MSSKNRLFSLIVICLTILMIIFLVKDSLCELHYRKGGIEVAASLACMRS
ncbi:Hok/Gef family protein [Buttiauxella selenatireducens]|uniref:Hok/Gef family protein n=1 Tax=Buttiauxella selenatireducens TaxID=3073902 RepID=A0ABY9S5R3_9ENTR|nr:MULTISPECIES: Hok/Gef family protein [unclassified Buttiauxella]WMY72353.1 Hok/Gef family protein [Buttiauxella sp. R73]